MSADTTSGGLAVRVSVEERITRVGHVANRRDLRRDIRLLGDAENSYEKH